MKFSVRFIFSFWLVWFGLAASEAIADTIHDVAHVANVSAHLPERPPMSGYTLSNALPGLRFEQPVALTYPPGETNMLFIVERPGSIYVITNLAEPTKTLFLDLTTATESWNVESGLLGMTFHPGYSTNRQFFVYRTITMSTVGANFRFHDVVSRFQAPPDGFSQVATNTETLLIAQVDDSTQHNAGDLAFGPDGYLYISVGEHVNRDQAWLDQTPIDRDLQGAILRIDVDGRAGSLPPNNHPASTTNYWIPGDNPFVGATQHHGFSVDPTQVRTELYAMGLRNPWRISFDSLTGELFAGEVGESTYEEVNQIFPGGDYGWPYVEGALVTGYSPPPAFSPLPPLYAYPHGWSGGNSGDCVIGGMVYRGSAIPALTGTYVFGDFRSGYLWSLKKGAAPVTLELLTGSTIGLSSFHADPRDGEILATHLYDGRVLKLIHLDADQATDVPPTLADTGIFQDLESLQVAPGVIPYEINLPFWSDNAIKSRWFCLPDGVGPIGFQETNNWNFPDGAFWVKHFDLQLTNGQPASTRRVETRVMVKSPGGIYGLTYRWGDSLTNAVLVPEAGADETFTIRDTDGTILRQQRWRYPSRSECLDCHTEWAGRALGFNTAQLNREILLSGILTNQIAAFAAAGYLDRAPAPDAELPALAKANDPGAPLEFRFRSYLQANCSPCHVPEKHTLTLWDARLTTPLDLAAIVPPATVVVPGSPLGSKLYTHLLGYPRLMPPIGTSVLNTNAINLVGDWITNLPPSPWSYGTLGTTVHFGGASVSNGVFILGGVGKSWIGAEDAFEYLHQSMTNQSGATEVIVRLVNQSSAESGAMAGLMLRAGTGASDPFFLSGVRGDGVAGSVNRNSAGEFSHWTGPGETVSLPQWLRVVKRGLSFEGFRSPDGVNWTSVGAGGISSVDGLQIGLAANSGSGVRFNNAVFDNLSRVSVTLKSSSSSKIAITDTLRLTAMVEADGRSISKVEFYEGATKLGEALNAPYEITTSGFWAGSHAYYARAIDETGTALNSDPITVIVDFAPAQATLVGTDSTTGGSWLGRYGKDGFLAVNILTNLPSWATVTATGATATTWDANSGLLRDLTSPQSGRRIGAGWVAADSFVISINLPDGDLHRVSLYCTDSQTVDKTVQKVESIDPATGTILSAQTITRFSSGRYVQLLLRGRVDVRITSISGGRASVSGIFFDPNRNIAPSIQLIHPTDGDLLVLPSELPLEAAALDQDGSVQRIEFFVDGVLRVTVPGGIASTDLSGLTEGVHTVFARAYDDLGDRSDTPTVTIQSVLPRASGAFLRQDKVTRGDWSPTYGKDGFLLLPITNLWPETLSYSIDGALEFTWVGYDPDFLAFPSLDYRQMPLLYSTGPITFDFKLAFGRTRTITAYIWDDATSVETVTLLDASNEQILDQTVVTNGAGGVYCSFSARGHVKLRIDNPTPGEAQTRVSGIFLDPFTNTPPDVVLLEPTTAVTSAAPARIYLAATNSSSVPIQRIEFRTVENGLIGKTTTPPYEFLFSYPTPGDYQVFARAVSIDGATADSPSVSIQILPTNLPSQARFAGFDTTTGYTWRGNYGLEGYWIPSTLPLKNLPTFLSVSNSQDWLDYGEWDLPGRLQLPTGNRRILSFWVGGTNWQFRVGTLDGKPHRISLYNVSTSAWTNTVTFNVWSSDAQTLLDTQSIPEQVTPRYLRWDIRGEVLFEIVTDYSFRSFVNALFVDATPDGYTTWLSNYFTLAQQGSPLVTDPSADPDGDGADNWSEYCLGRNPVVPDGELPSLICSSDPQGLVLKLTLSSSESDAASKIQVSTDLQSWQPMSNLQLIAEEVQGARTQHTYLVPTSDLPTRFFRLTMSAPW